MPALQDMLDDFDGKHLEELAEALLAKFLEGDAPGSGAASSEVESNTKPLFGSMVGTQAEKLEPCQDINGSLSTPTRRPKPIKEEPYSNCVLLSEQTSPMPPAQLTMDQMEPLAPVDSTIKNTTQNQYIITSNPENPASNDHLSHEDDETLYGTYDEENNCITVVLSDEDISNFEEVIEETTCSDEDDEYISISSPHAVKNSIYCFNHQENDAKSPVSTMTDRDSAYESFVGSSPDRSFRSLNDLNDYFYSDGMCYDSFSELFPSLH